MVDVSTVELVALHLWSHRSDTSTGQAPYELSTLGIGDALHIDDTLSGRVDLLTTLADMKDDGLLVEDRSPVAGLAGRRKIYHLTDASRQLARDVSNEIDDATIDVVDDGETTRVHLDALDEVLPDVPLVEALARTTEDGVLHSSDGSHDHGRVIGRQPELATLRDCIESVQAGASETVLVAGESGIGKTTLVEHALEDARDRDVAILTGTGTEDATEPYMPFRAALARHREAVPTHLFEADSTATDTDVADIAGLADRRQALFYDVGRGVADLADERPLALFLDDLHAADPGTIALFEYLSSSLDDEPVLLVGTYRPEELDADHPLRRLVADIDDWNHLELGHLDQLATRALIERTLDDRYAAPEFVETIHARTGGHPLFVEATVSQLREQGVVDPHAGHYPDDPDLPLPRQVRTAIERRLDALDDTARAVIDAASVVGTTVDFRVLATVVDLPEADLREYVDLLTAASIWTRQADAGADATVVTDGGQLAFANEVVRDAVRDQIDDRTRRQLHERVAGALERVHADDLDAHAGAVAGHYERAGAPERAIEYYWQAGDHAASVYAHETAVDNYKQALTLAREHDREETVLSLLKQVGEVHLNADEYEDADRYFEYVLERSDDSATDWEIATHRASLRKKRGEFDAAVEVADRTLDRWDGETATPEVRSLLATKAWSLRRKGENERARDPAETQLALADRLDDPRERSDALDTLAKVERAAGNIEAAIELSEKAIEAARTAGDKRRQAFSRTNLGTILSSQDVESALEMFEDGLRLHREANTPFGEMAVLTNIGACLGQIGEWDRSLARIENALERAQKLDAEQFVAVNTVNIGTVYYKRGELASAREYLDRGLELAEAVEYRRFVEDAHVTFARLEYRQGNFEDGEAHADAVIQTDESSDIVTKAYSPKGRLRLAQDDLEGALAAHERGYERATAVEMPRSRIRNLCGLADVHRLAGRLEAAREKAEAARQTAAEQSNPLVSVEAALALGRVQRVSDPERAEETLQAALDDARELGAAVHECEALYELGRLHDTRGDQASARDSLETALALAEETGATLNEYRARSALDSLQGDS